MSGYGIANHLLDAEPLVLRDTFADLYAFTVWATDTLGVCSYDHHGYCQAHFLDEKPCPVEKMRTGCLMVLADVEPYE